MNIGIRRSMVAVLLLMITACADNSKHPSEPPLTNLDTTGIYQGTLETEQGNVALMTLVLGRTGQTTIAFETDDSEQATIILWGESTGNDSELSFSGADADSGERVAIDLQVSDEGISGKLNLAALKGGFSLSQTATSGRAGSLDQLAGQYARNDAIDGLVVLVIGADGSAELSGPCDASGSIATIDEQVNIYLLTLSSPCLDLEALVSSEDIETTMDVLSLTGSRGDAGIDIDLFRIN